MMVFIVVGVMAGLLAVVGLVALFRWTVGADQRRAKVLSQGEAGMAHILGWERTGASHGRDDILRFTLAIRLQAQGTEFQATADRLVRPMEAPLFQEGMQRPVRVLRDGARLLVELE
ncbi:hypothetical protein MYSTI_02194 [Myxococcus stipitatus DSM 14675]|uniref:Uncharacterized protein n=1 Tax=Myxococcus stipitatus (strain DSM 14675 / JCM 12634 / Mx s8) TaxID=1278073 RepID=L7U425_MYXSD|nr:hypothetical protein [Myxococcus stipitatus]AGC43521.1 hypothetical protein MYSTI_02194 [Myxococcus stipitatus DSM 14675]